MDLFKLISKGFLPKELPPPFSSNSFALYINVNHPLTPSPNPNYPKKKILTTPATHNLARSGGLRRKLHILNPFNFYLLATEISDNWTEIIKKISQSKLSVSIPVVDPNEKRALVPKIGGTSLINKRVEHRAGKRFVLKTDITRFYPSIYTHSIPWAIDGKTQAKLQRDTGMGNNIDRFVRNGQDGQTVGIPVGPDTSLVIAEIIASAIDNELTSLGLTGFRFMDDYEFCFQSRSEAETALVQIESNLGKYELGLNPQKTKIEELPIELDYSWRRQILQFNFGRNRLILKEQLTSFFDTLFRLHQKTKHEPIIQYGLSKLRSIKVDKFDWTTLCYLLSQCIVAEPSSLPSVLELLVKHQDFGIGTEIENSLNYIISAHSPLMHDSEVAWALWTCIRLNLKIESKVVPALEKSDDSVVRILGLHARDAGCFTESPKFKNWENSLSRNQLYDKHWLFAYEANIRDWFNIKEDFVKNDENFCKLKDNDISFFKTKDIDEDYEADWTDYSDHDEDYEDEESDILNQ